MILETIFKDASKAIKSLEPIKFEEVIDSGINKPGRYLGNELGVKKRHWNKESVLWAWASMPSSFMRSSSLIVTGLFRI